MRTWLKNPKKTLIKVCVERGKPEKDPTAVLDNYMEFFIAPPVDLDPAGVMKKFELIQNMGEEKVLRND